MKVSSRQIEIRQRKSLSNQLRKCVEFIQYCKNGKGSPYSVAKLRVPELIPVLGS